jgi:hypothetical protein
VAIFLEIDQRIVSEINVIISRIVLSGYNDGLPVGLTRTEYLNYSECSHGYVRCNIYDGYANKCDQYVRKFHSSDA